MCRAFRCVYEQLGLCMDYNARNGQSFTMLANGYTFSLLGVDV